MVWGGCLITRRLSWNAICRLFSHFTFPIFLHGRTLDGGGRVVLNSKLVFIVVEFDHFKMNAGLPPHTSKRIFWSYAIKEGLP